MGDSGRTTACAPINIDFTAEMWKESGEPLDVTLVMQKRLVHITLLPDGEWAASIIVREVLDSAMQVAEERASNVVIEESDQVHLTTDITPPSQESSSNTNLVARVTLMHEGLTMADEDTASFSAPKSASDETPAQAVRGARGGFNQPNYFCIAIVRNLIRPSHAPVIRALATMAKEYAKAFFKKMRPDFYVV